jgi:ATP-dependent DNA ligase
VHEIKRDGNRLIVRRDGETVRLFTRRGYDWTDKRVPQHVAHPNTEARHRLSGMAVNFARLPVLLGKGDRD